MVLCDKWVVLKIFEFVSIWCLFFLVMVVNGAA